MSSSPTGSAAMEAHRVRGLHHVTALASDPQANVDFYAGLLGLRLVKKTVNFDDPGTYHLYYGNELGEPGTILTFFPWPGARRGQRGAGQVTVIRFSVPAGSLGAWAERLARHGVAAEAPVMQPNGEETLAFLDRDGLLLELVAHEDAARRPAWEGGPIAPEQAIRGFHSVGLSLRHHAPTAALLTEVMGFHPVDEQGNRLRFAAGEGGAGTLVDLFQEKDAGAGGRMGAGIVHHVAWRLPDDASELALRERITASGLQPTPQIDRQYFRSVYFREPGGVLFELATDPPGFTRDEEPAHLGERLMLPPWLEPHRGEIETALPALAPPAPGQAREPAQVREEGGSHG